jgi:hypothetical protein
MGLAGFVSDYGPAAWAKASKLWKGGAAQLSSSASAARSEMPPSDHPAAAAVGANTHV